MRIALTVDEAVALARAARPLPPMVLDVRPAGDAGDAVEADLDPAQVPGASGLLRFAGALSGAVTVTARFCSWSDGDAAFTVAARARGISVDRLLNHLVGTLRETLAGHGLPPDLVELRAAPGGPELVVHVQRAADARASGVVVREVGLRAGTLHAEVGVEDDVHLR